VEWHTRGRRLRNTDDDHSGGVETSRVTLRVEAATRFLLGSPARVGGIMILGGVAAIIVAIAFIPMDRLETALLLVIAAYGTAMGCVGLIMGSRMPRWILHLDLVTSTFFTSVLCLANPSARVDFELLFLWIVYFAALYFRPREVVAYYALVAVAYVAVLVLEPARDRSYGALFAVLGTAAVLGVITVGLLSALRQSSERDFLTMLANRRSWEERVEEELERARRRATPLSLVIIDIDNFKVFNDRDGHQAGDRLLRQLADGWREVVRGSGDFVARIGGDEFGLLTPGTDEVGIDHVIGRLAAAIPDGVSCSFGAATWDGRSSAADVFRIADEAMYRSKRERRRGRTSEGSE
jgi:diguanylate cyclase (GGDEF)-like protein